ncbi:hypothetical protein [Reichenbachiella ulvae]|uniref:Uncharacterized protein n=1 Tax=Reichenbachiella ulvae TaxID=2980104 RepID=A0ABT3CR62_9BACT|nr:hypothetical protein [Reichenbachiella ulvae]MCV9386186.1 hypothetical protein [Reichenbachiella ulvae]
MKLKKRTSITAILFMTLLLFSFSKSDKWVLFESTEYGFKVDFPKEPTSNPQTVNSEIGLLKMNIFMYEASNNKKDDNLVYMVNSTEYPDTLINSNKTEILYNFFRNSIDGAVNNVHGKLLSETVITIDEYPGREIRVDFQNGKAVITMRLYLVKNQMYMLQTITETNKDFNNSIKRFFDSFELL